MPSTLSIVGAGRVGRALGARLRISGWKINLVVTRSESTARRAVRTIGTGTPSAVIPRSIVASRLILIATPDDSVATVAEELARVGGEELRGKIVLHTSGGLDISVLKPLRLQSAAIGALHPLQTFTNVGVPSLEGRIFAIEGDPAAIKLARQIVRTLGGSPVQITPGKRALYHAAATLAAGHILAVEEAAVRMMTETGMKRREAIRALLPLTRQVLDNFERLGSGASWTGPLARADYNLISKHYAALDELPAEFTDAYSAVNRLAARILSNDPEKVLSELGKISVRTKPKVKAMGGKA
jgi:predicted short-subunit dehydrogenase-like oxidoreductase (DUF2520 family)